MLVEHNRRPCRLASSDATATRVAPFIVFKNAPRKQETKKKVKFFVSTQYGSTINRCQFHLAANHSIEALTINIAIARRTMERECRRRTGIFVEPKAWLRTIKCHTIQPKTGIGSMLNTTQASGRCESTQCARQFDLGFDAFFNYRMTHSIASVRFQNRISMVFSERECRSQLATSSKSVATTLRS